MTKLLHYTGCECQHSGSTINQHTVRIIMNMQKQAWSLSCCALALTLCAAPAAFAEKAQGEGKHLTGPDHDQGDKILMHPEDESIGFTKTILRDTSKDPALSR